MVKLIPKKEIFIKGPLMYVYFISDGTAIKIGKSADPSGRLNSLQTGNPRELELLGTNHFLFERDIHELFRHLLIQGEWFEYTPEILDFIDANKTKHYTLSLKSKEDLIKIILGDV